MKYEFIVNPNARSGLGGRRWKEAEAILKRRNIEYQAYLTRYQLHASRIAAELTADGREHTLVILGGDGTVNEVLNGIRDLQKVTLGYIPIGSSNDFARYFGHTPDMEEALERILHPRRYVRMDVGRISCRKGQRRKRFAVSAGLGFDAAVCHQAMVSRLKVLLNRVHLGKLTYVGIALSKLLALPPCTMEVTLDGGKPVIFEQAYFTAVMNHPYEGGGFRFCPEADPCDGRLDVTVIAGIPKWKVLLLLPTAFLGKHTGIRGVHIYTCREMTVKSACALPVHTDGEPVMLQREFSAALEPSGVRLIV